MAESENVHQKVDEKAGVGSHVCRCPRWISQLSQSQTQSAFAAFLHVLMTFLISFASVSGATASELICLKGVPGFAGATFPAGDIFLKSGDTLEVYCTLNLTHPMAKGYNASNIEFSFKKHEIPSELIQKTVLNATTAMIRVENMNASSPKLDCEIPRPNGHPIPICENRVDVGFIPLEVENFRCIAKDWRSIRCTWDPPYNPIPTVYKLHHEFKGGVRLCPNETVNSCQWGPYADPHYLPNVVIYNLRLNGTNPLNPKGKTWDYPINHFSIVVPQKPEFIDAEATSPNTIMLNWTFPLFEQFEPGLFHRVTVCAEGGFWCNTTMLESTKKEQQAYLASEIQVPFAFVNYSVNISMRSQTALDTEEFWSEPATTTVTTWGTRPAFPPKTDIGSFESLLTSSLQERDVYVYWEQVPRTHHNGPKFRYYFTVFEEDQLRNDIRPVEITQSYAKFVKLRLMKTYRFAIYSQNANGTSLQKSEVFVPSNTQVVGEPRSVSKLDFTNGTFQISWQPPKNASSIVSYTVFKCNSTKPRPYQCEGLLEWYTVPVEERRKLFHYLPHHENRLDQFAVSANTNQFSSGMLWASCTLIHNKVPEKLRNVKKVNATMDSITIEWSLDCSYQSGTVKGFKITYCMVNGPSAESCTGNENYTAVEGADKTSYHLKELNPYSTYMISVSVQTVAGESQKSDPIFERTAEGIPSVPPTPLTNFVTNTTATITVEPPSIVNGKLADYIVYYEPSNFKGISKERKKIVSENVAASINLTDLVSNTNYSLIAKACTRNGCSANSSQIFFMTGIGATNINDSPSLIKDRQGNFVAQWGKPKHVGGPIKYFEISLKYNGKDVNKSIEVQYDEGIPEYVKELPFSCKADTNLTARIRAATMLGNGDIILGEWSPEGKHSCEGASLWFVWLSVVIGAIVVIVVISLVSIKLYHYIKDSSKIEVKLPPGLAVSDLNGFSNKHNTKRVRKSSGGDMEPYGKENLTYQLQMTSSHTDESKDFLSSDSNPREADSFQRFSPSASNPLLSEMDMNGDMGGDGSGTDDDDPINPHYKMLGLMSNGSAVVIDSDTESEMMMMNPSSMMITIPPTQSYSRSNGLNGLDEDDSSDKLKTVPSRHIANGPAYVKWRSEPKNGDSTDRSSRYCQVGILS